MSTLRQRILDAMPEILLLVANEQRGIGTGGDGDFRHLVVEGIRRIAELDGTTPYRLRQARNRVAKDAKRLQLSLKKLPPAAQAGNQDGLDWLSRLAAQADNVPEAKKGKAPTHRKQLAASLACDLLLDYGGHTPTLTKGGPYLTLAGLLYKTATGRDGDLENACSKHFASLKTSDEPEPLDLTARHLRSLGPTSPMPSSLLALIERDRAKERQRRIAAARSWPPLQQIIDDLLG